MIFVLLVKMAVTQVTDTAVHVLYSLSVKCLGLEGLGLGIDSDATLPAQ